MRTPPNANQVGSLHIALRDGKPEAWTRAYGLYFGDLCDFIARNFRTLEYTEIASTAFEKALKKCATFDPDRSFKNWLWTIATNTATDAVRKELDRSTTHLEDDPNLLRTVSTKPSGDTYLEWLEDAVQRLEPQHRSFYNTLVNAGHNMRAVASQLGIARQTAYNRYHDLLCALKADYDKHGPTDQHAGGFVRTPNGGWAPTP